jgi:hypothetical protein
VFIGSDSEGKFGYQCPRCDGYWRADGGAMICPYCGTHAAGHQLLMAAQVSYASINGKFATSEKLNIDVVFIEFLQQQQQQQQQQQDIISE